jgi:hypothetical protein
MVNTWPLVQSSGEMNHQGYALCCDLGELDVNMHVLLLFKIDFTYKTTPRDVIQIKIFS